MDERGPRGRGRPRRQATSRVAAAGLRLIREHGFEATTAAAIAAEAGIGRSTFFRYFASKDEILWHCHAEQVMALEARLAGMPDAPDPLRVVMDAVVDAAGDVRPGEARAARDYQAIIVERPDLDPMGAAWSQRRTTAIRDYVAAALGRDRNDALPVAFAFAVEAAVRAAGVAFAHSEGVELADLVASCVRPVYVGFSREGMGPSAE